MATQLSGKKFKISAVIFVLILIYFLGLKPTVLSPVMNEAYNTILIGFCVMSLYGCYIFSRKDLFLFEPITVIFALYVAIFFYQPCMDIYKGDLYLVGKDVFPGCDIATTIVVISFGFLLIGYFSPFYGRKQVVNKLPLFKYPIHRNTSLSNTHKILHIAYVIWGVSWIIYVVSWAKARGASLSYVLTLGGAGEVDAMVRSQAALGFLFNFGSCLIASYAYIFVYEKKRIIKYSLFVLTVIAYMFAGYRFIIVQFITTLIIYYYAKCLVNPKGYIMGGLAGFFLVFASVMEFIRGGLRTGVGVNVEGYSLVQHILSPFESNFTLYKVMYRFVMVFPDQYPFTYGSTMIWETIYYMVPRAIWPEKPRTELFTRMAEAFGPEILTTGTALNNIAEYYYEFGILGCLVCMFLFGWIFGCARDLFRKKNTTDHDLIFFSMLFSIAFSCVNAGYMPMNFYMVLLTLAPVWIIKKLTNKKYANNSSTFG